MYCIAFNGPPRVGKDTIADLLDHHFDLKITPGIRKSLATPLRLMVYAMLGRTFDAKHYESEKDIPQPMFDGHTIREMMIRASEEWIKPVYGQGALARMTVSSLGTSIHLPGVCLISDSGFQPETDVLVDAFGEDRFLMVQLEREGAEWGADSRGYVEAPHWIRIYNPRDQQAHVVQTVLDMCDDLGWEL
jgi:hypothetical protein